MAFKKDALSNRRFQRSNVVQDAHAAELAEENKRLRAALAMSKSPCVYCSLPAEEWNKCASGFPGCARGDDALGCPELGATIDLRAARERMAELETELVTLREQNEAAARTRKVSP